jgi:phosphoglycerate kinase
MTTQLAQIKNSTVLVRTNYDLPDLNHLIRIDDSLPTIKQLLDQNNKVIICTHWGRPVDNDPKFSTDQLDEILEGKLRENVLAINQYDSFDIAKGEIQDSKAKVILLQNTRYNKGEKSKDENVRKELAAQYASLASYFVDEAFAVSHRHEATNYDIKNLLPWTFGLSHQAELDNLNQLKNNPKKPFVAIMGGAKLETKLALINNLLPKVDKIILGGMLSYTFLKAIEELQTETNCPTEIKEFYVAEYYFSLVEESFVPIAKELLLNNWDKIVLPIDFVYGELEAGKAVALDIGLESVLKFQEVTNQAQTIFWNGPMGFYEKPPYHLGTLRLGEHLASLHNCHIVIGGGDVGSALPVEVLSQFSWVSMGGGATLEYLSK